MNTSPNNYPDHAQPGAIDAPWNQPDAVPSICPWCGEHDLLHESKDGSVQYGVAPEVCCDSDGTYFLVPKGAIVYCPDCGEVTASDMFRS